MKTFCSVCVIILLFTGCEMDLTGLAKLSKKLSDQKFNGIFSIDMSNVMYGRGSHTYKFDGTTHAVHETFQYYASGSDLSYIHYEIEVSNGQLRMRHWSEFGSWDSWEDYHFDDEGNLWIGILEYKKKYENRVATPIATPQPGLIDLGTTVTLTTTTQGAAIYYTTDESDPIDSGRIVYTDPVRIDKDTTIKAIGIKNGMTDSAILTANYTINIPNVEFKSVTANGKSGIATTTEIKLNIAIPELSIDNILIESGTGAKITSLMDTENTIIINGITSEGEVKITIAKDGYNILPPYQIVNIYYHEPLNLEYLEMVHVPGGVVTSNTGNEGGPFYNASQENVTVSPFYIGKYEVTYALWYDVMKWATDSIDRGDKIYSFDTYPPTTNGIQGAKQGARGNNYLPTALLRYHPVSLVTWEDAVVWCNAYSEMTGKTPVYEYNGEILRKSDAKWGAGTPSYATVNQSANGFRLPTEAEWECAARGGGAAKPTGVSI